MKITKTGPLVRIEHSQKATPSWRPYGTGTARLDVRTHRSRPWLDLTIEEIAEPSANKPLRWVTRSASITLSEADARAFFEALRDHFDEVDLAQITDGKL